MFASVQPSLHAYPVDTDRWLRQAVITTGSSSLALLPHLGLV
jgi:hypothetical protein